MRVIDVRTGQVLQPGGHPTFHDLWMSRQRHAAMSRLYNVQPVRFQTPTWVRLLEVEPGVFDAHAFVEGVRMDPRAGAAGATNA